MSAETQAFRNGQPEPDRGTVLQGTAAAVLDARTKLNDTLISHGPDSLEARAAHQQLKFAQAVASEMIAEN